MSVVLKIDEQKIADEELLPLLIKYRMLPQLAREVIVDRAIADIQWSAEEQEKAQQQWLGQQQIRTQEHLQAWLQQQGFNAEQFQQHIERQGKLQKFKEATWGPQLEACFLSRKRQLDKVIYSLIRLSELGVAQELYFQIQEQEKTFTELAKQYSLGPEAQTGGLVGPVELGTPHPQIAQMLATSEPGQLLPPVRIGEWWIILRLEKLISAQLNEPTRQKLLEEQFAGWLREQLQQKVSLTADESPSDVLTP
ncbi:MAG: peptidylprolyl isomerase [Cyanophyceae cyanobacterium]